MISACDVGRSTFLGHSFCEKAMNDTTATAIAGHTSTRNEPSFTSLGLAAAAEAIRNGDITSEAYATALLQQRTSDGRASSPSSPSTRTPCLPARRTQIRHARQGQRRPFWACRLA